MAAACCGISDRERETRIVRVLRNRLVMPGRGSTPSFESSPCDGCGAPIDPRAMLCAGCLKIAADAIEARQVAERDSMVNRIVNKH